MREQQHRNTDSAPDGARAPRLLLVLPHPGAGAVKTAGALRACSTALAAWPLLLLVPAEWAPAARGCPGARSMAVSECLCTFLTDLPALSFDVDSSVRRYYTTGRWRPPTEERCKINEKK